jgi:D-alanyl-D-alanine carboxypeptidase (penicillin-binding protein 5/6)
LICAQVFLQDAFGQETIAPPDVTASSAFVLNAETGQPLYAKNENEVFWILSLTKLITAYVLVDRMGDRLSETVTVDWPHLVRGSTAGLKRRDVWSLQDLLYGMVLVSGNDASVAIADHTGRALLAQEKKRDDSIKRFVEEMRSAATALGATHANFADPYGLSPANVATARDVGLIAASVFTDPRLLPAWACSERTVEIGGPKARTVTLQTTLEILGEDGVIGAKTGSHVGKNIYNLVTAWRAPNGQTIVGVVLGSASHPARYEDLHAIMAAVPRDYPELGEPVTDAVSQTDGTSCH